MEEYQSQMKGLGERIIRLIFKFLDISEEEMMKLLTSTDESAGKPYMALRLNSYPPCPDPSRVMGLAAHTDTSLFTIVHQARHDGLQVFKDGTGWVPLSPMSGTLIVNVGDILHILSNGRFPSILHRVMIHENKEHRLSLAYFYDPPGDLYISPYCKPLSESPQIPLYRCVNVKEYFTIKAKKEGKGLSAIKIWSLKFKPFFICHHFQKGFQIIVWSFIWVAFNWFSNLMITHSFVIIWKLVGK